MSAQKIRVSVWIDPDLWFLAKKDELSFSNLMEQTLSHLYGIAPDPEKELLEVKRKSAVSRVQIIYEQKVRSRDLQQQQHKLIEEKQIAQMERLLSLGQLINGSKYKDSLLEGLSKKELDDQLWECFNQEEVQQVLGNGWDYTTVYNQSLEWFRNFGAKV